MLLRFLLLVLMAFPLWSATPPITAEAVVPRGLSEPVGLACVPGDSSRLFVIEQHTGNVQIVGLTGSERGQISATPFITENDVLPGYEQGLLGIAFHPNFAANGYVYLNCNKDGGGPAGHTEIVRYTANRPFATATTVDPLSRIVVLSYDQPETNHNGGWLGFGADGYLYIAAGDGGGMDDWHGSNGNAQDLSSRLGKLLRLDVSSATQPYTVPPGNMTGTGVDPLIFAFGLRNPWRCSFDRANGNLWIGDVGQFTLEEISFGPAGVAGRNYGWRRYEGNLDYLPTTVLANSIPATPPVLDYSREFGSSVIGGYVYRGAAIPALQGTYIYADYVSQRFFAFTAGNGTATNQREITDLLDPHSPRVIRSPSSFGEDAAGELYFCDHQAGAMYQIIPTIAASAVAFTVQPAKTNVSTSITPAVQVAITAADGSIITTASNTISIALGTNPGGAALSGTTSVNAIHGIATFANLALDKAGAGYTLTAKATGLSTATSTAFTILDQVAEPVITPGDGRTFSGPITVQIRTSTSGATIRYTLDGSTPTGSSPIYTGPISLTATTTVRAIALRPKFQPSNLSRALLTITGSVPYGIATRPLAKAYLGLPTNPYSGLPTRLSDTGVFSSVVNLTPGAALIPYGVNMPYWSDNAIKRRWVAVPNDGEPYTAEETVTFAPTGEWAFPAGTVFVKHFDLVTDERTPTVRRRLETRLLVRAAAGGVYGMTYRWNTNQSDAGLVTTAQTADITIINSSGVSRTQTWYFPSPTDCLQCHNSNAGYVLGLNTRQLNGLYTYPASGVRDLQLRAWNSIGLFQTVMPETSLNNLPQLASLDSGASLELRARSYLDSNCSSCHRFGGAPANFDARFDTPFANQGLINQTANNDLGIAGAKIIVPQDVARSLLYQRIHSLDTKIKMPPLGRNVIDDQGTTLIAQWIGAMAKDGSSPPPPPSPAADSSGGGCGLGSAALIVSLALLAFALRRLR